MKRQKPIKLVMFLSTLALFLSGCVQRTQNGKPFGVIYDYLAVPGQHVMEWTASLLGNSYGWAIIAVTIAVRLVLLPVMMIQMRKSTVQMEKMNTIRPHITKLKEQQKKAKTQKEQSVASQQIMQLYRDNGISMTGGIGCLPLLIQIPIFAALYAAIQYSPELSSSIFFSINLGNPSIILAILSFAAYLLQGYLSMMGTPVEQRKTMQFTMLISPIFILLITLSSPAGLGLYFFIGGIFACLQTILINKVRPLIRRQIEEEAKKNPPKIVDIENSSSTATISQSKSYTEKNKLSKCENQTKYTNQKRNAGKQHHQHD